MKNGRWPVIASSTERTLSFRDDSEPFAGVRGVATPCLRVRRIMELYEHSSGNLSYQDRV